VDAKNTWKSKKWGDGSMTIIESVPYKKVTSKLDFGVKGISTGYFTFDEVEGGTMVTWGLDIPELSYPMERYFGLMMPAMMKPVFKQGLDKMKEIAEAIPDPPALQIVEMQEKAVITVIDSCSWSDIGMKMGVMFTELITAQTKAKCEITGTPFSLYHKWDEVNQFTVFENCLPVDREVAPKGRVQYKVMPSTRAVMGTHFGAYEKTMYMYIAMDEYIKDFGLQQSSGPIEEYVTDPMTEPDTAKWQTNIYFPVK
jgi:effector-binding domain-containing protein